MLKGNKGEWSEIYALLKLLGDGKVYSADENTEKVEEDFFPIVKIVRSEKQSEKYEYVVEDTTKKVKIVLNGTPVGEYDASLIDGKAKELLSTIVSAPIGGTFPASATEAFMNTLGCYMLKAPVFGAKGKKLGKTDITMQIYDAHTGRKPTSGFSVKSRLGGAATLLNASGATNFIYEVEGLTATDIREINAINDKTSKVRKRLSAIREKGARIRFSHMANKTFACNLELTDSKFCEVLANSLIYYYSGEATNCLDIIDKLTERNPLCVSNRNYYRRNYKDFLVDVTLGMEPATSWDGNDEAEGGCIWVKENGEVLVYYIWNHNKLEDYLVNNTKFDTPSTTKHKFASLYTEGGKTYINLNMQIRFIK